MAKTDPFSGYTKAEGAAKPRLIASSYGEVGTLKTSFWLGAPGPIVVLSFDKGLEGVIEPYQDLKDIYVKEFAWATAVGEKPDQDAAIAVVDEFTEVFEHSINIPGVRTVFIDKETDMWSAFKYAKFGPPEKGKPEDWDGLKNQVRRLLNMPKALDINFGVIQGMRNEWIPGPVNPNTGKKGMTQSGRRIPLGMDDVEAIMHVNIEHFREDGEFKMRIGKARGPGGREIQYQVLPALSFAEFGQLVFPGTDDSDWS
jgi:hypothetical protein